ncbi:hypothetical protein SD72_15335 [Leucobacter komagatae]|uniref:Uncharacterized protein n=1 Tax=Leucobacter komagatae TaxID=55969 RepID=A0A0D0IIJ0_9MICO|nr:hypothetical protein SD72_15335 [Leucobacter komagatae]
MKHPTPPARPVAQAQQNGKTRRSSPSIPLTDPAELCAARARRPAAEVAHEWRTARLGTTPHQQKE